MIEAERILWLGTMLLFSSTLCALRSRSDAQRGFSAVRLLGQGFPASRPLLLLSYDKPDARARVRGRVLRSARGSAGLPHAPSAKVSSGSALFTRGHSRALCTMTRSPLPSGEALSFSKPSLASKRISPHFGQDDKRRKRLTSPEQLTELVQTRRYSTSSSIEFMSTSSGERTTSSKQKRLHVPT